MLEIREAGVGAFERSERLQQIAAEMRATLPVRITGAGDVMDPERPYRILLADDVEHRVVGDTVEVRRGGAPVETRRRPWLERVLRRIGSRLTGRRLRRSGIVSPS